MRHISCQSTDLPAFSYGWIDCCNHVNIRGVFGLDDRPKINNLDASGEKCTRARCYLK